MLLKEMIKLINIFILSFFFISSFAQKSTFHQLTTDSSSYFINKTSVIGSDTLTITLKHEPTKPNDGTLASAGGETDIEVSFPINVQ